jgi:hypothetical protein
MTFCHRLSYYLLQVEILFLSFLRLYLVLSYIVLVCPRQFSFLAFLLIDYWDHIIPCVIYSSLSFAYSLARSSFFAILYSCTYITLLVLFLLFCTIYSRIINYRTTMATTSRVKAIFIRRWCRWIPEDSNRIEGLYHYYSL